MARRTEGEATSVHFVLPGDALGTLDRDIDDDPGGIICDGEYP